MIQKILHAREESAVIGNGRQHDPVVHKALFNRFRNILCVKVYHLNLFTCCLKIRGQPFNRLNGIAMQ